VWKFSTVLAVLLKLDESQRKRLESLFNTAYGVVKAGKPFSDYELICEIQVKNGFCWRVKNVSLLEPGLVGAGMNCRALLYS
jgi:hypothetical protein